MPEILISNPTTVGTGDTIASDTTFRLQSLAPPGQPFVLLSIATNLNINGRALLGDLGPMNAGVVIERGYELRVGEAGPFHEAIGYSAPFADGPSFYNDGRLTVTSSARAIGVDSWMDHRNFINQGVASAHGGTEAVVYSLKNGGSFFNSGLIEATAGSGSAQGVTMSGIGARFTNSGTIRATDQTPFDGAAPFALMDSKTSVGVWWGAAQLNGFPSSYFTNSGLIEAEVALRVGPYFNDTLTQNHFVVNESTGVLRGWLTFELEKDNLLNSGLIDGSVNLGGGDDFYNNINGRTTGLVSGGEGADHMRGGDYFDYMQGNQGADSQWGAGGGDWLVGGQGSDQLLGEAGDDIVYLNLGDDTGDGGAGADWVRGGQGDDSLSGGDGDDWMSGDRGGDTLSGGAGADIFNSFGDAGLDRITDFRRAEGDRVHLEPGTTYTVAQSGADVVISLSGGGQVVLVGANLAELTTGWIFTG